MQKKQPRQPQPKLRSPLPCRKSALPLPALHCASVPHPPTNGPHSHCRPHYLLLPDGNRATPWAGSDGGLLRSQLQRTAIQGSREVRDCGAAEVN